MPVSYMLVTGGNISSPAAQLGNAAPGVGRQPFLELVVQLPDTFSSSSVTFAGVVAPVVTAGELNPALPLTGSGIALPSVPGSGSTTLWGLEVNLATGAVQIKQNSGTTGSVAQPVPDSGNLLFFSHQITNGDTVPWMRAPALLDLN